MVQVSDMFHFVWDRLFGRHVIAPTINSTKTWEGLIGSAVCTAVFGILVEILFYNVTPFTWYGAGLMALLISVMGSSGSMTMSAIKRDRGIKDYGTLVTGHAGVLDRIDSVCFAAPIFFHSDPHLVATLTLCLETTMKFLEPPKRDDDLVRLSTFPSSLPAHSLRILLEACGVQAVVTGEESNATFGGPGMGDAGMVGVQVLVRRDDYEDAQTNHVGSTGCRRSARALLELPLRPKS